MILIAACIVNFTGPCWVNQKKISACKDGFVEYEKIYTGTVISTFDEGKILEISTNAYDSERTLIPVENCVTHQFYIPKNQ